MSQEISSVLIPPPPRTLTSENAEVLFYLNAITKYLNMLTSGQVLVKTTDTKISSGSVEISGQSILTVDTETGASDDLDTISGGLMNQILLVRSKNSSRTVTIKTGTGNINIGSDAVLNSVDKSIVLLYNGDYWVQFSRNLW